MNKRLSIGLLIALVGFPQISETIYTPALPSVAAGLGASVSMVEATLAIYFIGFALGVSIWGAISDGIGRRLTMLLGIIIYGIGTFACGYAQSIEALLGWRCLQAFGASVGSVITQTILRDAYDSTQRSKLFAVMSGVLAFSPALGPILGGMISEFLGWRANFWLLSLFAIILIVWSYMTLPETKPQNIISPTISQIGQLFKKMLSSRLLWGHVILIAGTNGVLFGFYQEAPFVFIEQLGIRPSYYGLLGLLIAGATIAASRFSYFKSSHTPGETMIHWGTNCVIIGAGLFTANVILGFSLIIALLALFTVFFGIGLIIPNSLSIALKPYQMSVGAAGSIFGGLYYLLIALFTWSMSLFHNGTALPLPVFMLILGILLAIGSKMVRMQILIKSR